jgi:hypothetical protein
LTAPRRRDAPACLPHRLRALLFANMLGSSIVAVCFTLRFRCECEFASDTRPHMALGPRVPDPPPATMRSSTQLSQHQIGGRLVLRVKSILGGLHHEYSLAPALR